MALSHTSPIKAFFEKFNRSIERAMGMFAQSGDIMIRHFGEELSVQMKNAQLLFDAEMEKLLNEIEEDPMRQMFVRMDELSDKIDNWEKIPFEFEEIASLDLAQFMSDIDFLGIGYKHRFIMKRIEGTTQIIKDGQPYVLTLVGTNLGTAPSGISTKVALLMGENYQRMIPASQSKTAQHVLVMLIPPDKLGVELSNDKPTTIDIKIRVVYKYRSGPFNLIVKKYDCEYPISMTIMPRHAGTLSVHAVYPVYNWVKIGTKEQYFNVTEGARNSQPSLFVPDNQRLENAMLDCDDHGNGGCAFIDSQNGPVYNPEHTRVYFDVNYHGPGFTEHVWADIFEYRHIRDDEVTIDKGFNWGELVELKIPVSRWSQASIKGNLVTGQEFGIPVEGHDKTQSIRVEQVRPGVDATFVQIKVRPLVM